MKKYLLKSLALVCCLLLQHSGVFAQAVICPTVVPTGVPTVAGTPGVTLPCGVPCATLTATATPALAATTSYSVSSITYAPFSFTAGTTPMSGATPITSFDDQFSNAVPIGFSFCYYGNTYTQVAIGTNGNISFNTTGATSVVASGDPWSISGPLPGASTGSLNAVRNCIMGPWQDLYPSGGGTIKYATYGTAPCRQFVVSWNSVALFVSAPAGTESTYQIVLYESSNIIDINIQKRVAYTGWNSGRAVTGIANNVATAPVTAFVTAPGENATTFAATNEAWRFTPTGTVSGWTYTWAGPTGSAGTGATITVCPTVTTTYTVTATAIACTGVSVSSPITVNLDGYVYPITGTTTICQGSTTTLTSASPGGTWSSGSVGVASVTPTGVVTGVSAGTALISYEIAGGCFDTATVTVIPLPAAITGPSTVCQPNSVTLSNSTPGGAWTSSNPAIASIGAGTGVVFGVDSGVVTITYTTGGICSTTRPFTVNPTAPITGTAEMCQYFNTTLFNPLVGGVWTTSNAAVATVTSIGAPAGDSARIAGLTPGTATITYTKTGCPMMKVVTVHPKPTPPTITSPGTYCQFEIPVPMAATGTSLEWYGPGTTAPMVIAPTPLTDVAGTVTYFVTQTSGFGCKSDSATAPVVIKPKPEAPLVRDTMYCQYFDQAAALSAVGTNLKWYTASGTLLGSAPVPPTDFVGSTTWYVTQTVNGCTSDKAPLTVTIIFKPDFTIKASGTKVCQFDTLVFSYNGPAMLGEGFLWDLPFGTTVVRGSIYDSVLTVRFDSASGAHTIYLTASNLNGMCFTTKALDIKVIPEPFAHSFIKPDICRGDTVLLALSNRSDNASAFTWLIDGTPLATATGVNIITANWHTGGPFLVSFDVPGNHIIKLQASVDGMCPSKIAPDTVKVHELPKSTFKILSVDSKICIEDSMQLQADTIAYGYTYSWTPDHSFYNNGKGTIWGRLESDRNVIKLTVTDPFGCKSTSSIVQPAEYCCKVVMPTAFSPNGDDKNDRYKPLFPGMSYHRVHIFRVTNRWGQTLFQSTDSDPSWDGTYNGVPQDMGVYFYYIKYDCGGKTMESKGDCTLVR